MNVTVSYGKAGLTIALPAGAQADVVRAREIAPLQNPDTAARESIRFPLGAESLCTLSASKQAEEAVIIISDATRPVPSRVFVPAIVEEIRAGSPRTHVCILVATGLHRPSTTAELERMLGKAPCATCEVVNHDANDAASLETLGTTQRGTVAQLNRRYVRAGLRVVTGYVEPHFFAGFTGGRKALVPGIAGAGTIQANHSPAFIGHPLARFGETCGNPIYEDAVEIAQMAPPDFCVNVTLDPRHQVTAMAAGAMPLVHAQLVEQQVGACFFPIPRLYDVVICNNGGYPLDLNLYQAVKSMAVGELAVKIGGAIIATNECSDGIGHAPFEQLIQTHDNPRKLLGAIEAGELRTPDLWQVQVLARVLTKADIYVVSSLPPAGLGTIGMQPAPGVEEALSMIQRKGGSIDKILVLPDGPLAIPHVCK